MRNLMVLAFACGAMVEGEGGSGQSDAAGDAQQPAACIQAMDTACGVRLSDIDAYRRVSSPGFDFAAGQTRMYEALRGKGISYTRFEVDAPTTTTAQGGVQYQIVPFSFAMSGGDMPAHAARGYFVAISSDDGKNWRFIDASSLTLEQLRKIMPTYSSKMLPLLGQGQGQ